MHARLDFHLLDTATLELIRDHDRVSLGRLAKEIVIRHLHLRVVETILRRQKIVDGRTTVTKYRMGLKKCLDNP